MIVPNSPTLCTPRFLQEMSGQDLALRFAVTSTLSPVWNLVDPPAGGGGAVSAVKDIEAEFIVNPAVERCLNLRELAPSSHHEAGVANTVFLVDTSGPIWLPKRITGPFSLM